MPRNKISRPARRRLVPALGMVLAVMAMPVSHADPATEGAAFSRDRILPLVSKPGKERGLFSKFEDKKSATWNSDFWGASLGFDQFTGVGWSTPHAGVLITPEHIVCAAHYAAWKGVHFYDAQGSYLGARLPARDAENKPISVSISPDIRVIKLDAPAPAGAKIYPLPDPKTYDQRRAWAQLPDGERPLLVATDWRNPIPKKTDDPKERQRWRTTRTAHPVTLAALSETSKTLHWRYGPHGDPAIDPSYRETVNRGDSGNPVFWVSRSGLVLASTFTGVGGGPDYGHPEIQAEIQKAIDGLGGEKDYTLRTVPVP